MWEGMFHLDQRFLSNSSGFDGSATKLGWCIFRSRLRIDIQYTSKTTDRGNSLLAEILKMVFFFNIFLVRTDIRSRIRWHHFKGTHSLSPGKFELQACFHFNTSCTTLYMYLSVHIGLPTVAFSMIPSAQQIYALGFWENVYLTTVVF